MSSLIASGASDVTQVSVSARTASLLSAMTSGVEQTADDAGRRGSRSRWTGLDSTPPSKSSSATSAAGGERRVRGLNARPAMDNSRRSAVRRDSDDETETTAGADGHSCVTNRRSTVVDDAVETPSHSKTMAVNMAAKTNQTNKGGSIRG